MVKNRLDQCWKAIMKVIFPTNVRQLLYLHSLSNVFLFLSTWLALAIIDFDIYDLDFDSTSPTFNNSKGDSLLRFHQIWCEQSYLTNYNYLVDNNNKVIVERVKGGEVYSLEGNLLLGAGDSSKGNVVIPFNSLRLRFSVRFRPAQDRYNVK
jgi:hypothetical protein